MGLEGNDTDSGTRGNFTVGLEEMTQTVGLEGNDTDSGARGNDTDSGTRGMRQWD